jgi:hypothetical protein
MLYLDAKLSVYHIDSVDRVKDSLLKNDLYGQVIDQHLKSIHQSKRRFKDQTKLYLAWSQRAALSTSLETNAQSHEINANILRVDANLSNIDGNVVKIQTTVQDFVHESQTNKDEIQCSITHGLNALGESLAEDIKNATCKL